MLCDQSISTHWTWCALFALNKRNWQYAHKKKCFSHFNLSRWIRCSPTFVIMDNSPQLTTYSNDGKLKQCGMLFKFNWKLIELQSALRHCWWHYYAFSTNAFYLISIRFEDSNFSLQPVQPWRVSRLLRNHLPLGGTLNRAILINSPPPPF